MKRYKLKINSPSNLEELLQEIYNEACKNIEDVQIQMNKLSSSIKLNDEIVDAKAKYAKAMNDFINSKDKAISRKLEIAKLMSEIVKYNGDAKKALDESENIGDWSNIMDELERQTANNEIMKEETKEYTLNKICQHPRKK